MALITCTWPSLTAAALTPGVALRLGPGLRPMMQEIKRNLRAKRYAAPVPVPLSRGVPGEAGAADKSS